MIKLWKENKEVADWCERMEKAFGGHGRELLN